MRSVCRIFGVLRVNTNSMEKKFKTNIKCPACVEKVTPYLNDLAGENKWTVDLTSPERTLTIQSDRPESEVKESLRKAGYTAEQV